MTTNLDRPAFALASVVAPESPPPPPLAVVVLSSAKWDKVWDKTCRACNFPALQLWQKEVVQRLAAGENAIVAAGTGAGKSVVWTGLWLAMEEGKKKKMIILVAPTKALQDDQAQELEQRGVPAYVYNEDTASTTAVADRFRRCAGGVYLVSPELLRENDAVKRQLVDPRTQAQVAALIVDEAHCVSEWGLSFRPDYFELKEVRSALGGTLPIAGLSATFPPPPLITFFHRLSLSHQRTTLIDASARRPEHYYDVVPFRYPKNTFFDLFRLLLPLSLLPTALGTSSTPYPPPSPVPHSDLPKSVIFFKTRDEALQACVAWRSFLPQHLSDAVALFTGSSTPEQRAETLSRFKVGDRLRMVFATEAFGLRCNVPGIEYAVEYGLSSASSFLSLCQHFGRAGRGFSSSPSPRARHFPRQAVCVWIVPPDLFGAPLPPDESLPAEPPSTPPPGPTYPSSSTNKAFALRTRLYKRDPHLLELVNLSAPSPTFPLPPSPLPSPPPPTSPPPFSAPAPAAPLSFPSRARCLAEHSLVSMRPTASAYLAERGTTTKRYAAPPVEVRPERCCSACRTEWRLSLCAVLEGSADAAGRVAVEAEEAEQGEVERRLERAGGLVGRGKEQAERIKSVSSSQRAALSTRLQKWAKEMAGTEASRAEGKSRDDFLCPETIKALVQSAHVLRHADERSCLTSTVLRREGGVGLEKEEEEEIADELVEQVREWVKECLAAKKATGGAPRAKRARQEPADPPSFPSFPLGSSALNSAFASPSLPSSSAHLSPPSRIPSTSPNKENPQPSSSVSSRGRARHPNRQLGGYSLGSSLFRQ
ncbi:hypothetical protein JCM6882_002049 [Rhodosporidiobolus microsporus]